MVGSTGIKRGLLASLDGHTIVWFSLVGLGLDGINMNPACFRISTIHSIEEAVEEVLAPLSYVGESFLVTVGAL